MKNTIIITIALLALAGSALAASIMVGPFENSAASDAVAADPVFYNELGYKLAQEGSPVEAQAAFARAVTLRPEYDNARSNLATIAFQNADYETGITNLRVLVARNPGNDNYRFDLAQNLVHQARYNDADLDKLREAASIFDALGSYPHASENAAVVKNVIAEFS